ncbi:MAG TPA: four helix bundle protein [Gemmatimonadaceae bacterium]|nr:four helix bundle protein [Gemmatimonadaceae bacterium]
MFAEDQQQFYMFPFRKLAVWQRAHRLTLSIHEVTERVYRGRYASLINQMRRASMSIAANISEGSGQVTPAQFARYLTIAIGSVRELDYHVLLAKDLGLLPLSDYARLDARIDQVAGMLTALRVRVLEKANAKPARNRMDRVRAVSPPSPIRHPPSR